MPHDVFEEDAAAGGGLSQATADTLYVHQDGTGLPSSVVTAVGLVNPKQLKYAPPPQTTPTVVSVPTTFFEGDYADDEDVILVMPNAVRTGNLSVQGGRNVRMIGGYQKSTSSGGQFNFGQITGSVFIEGAFVDNASQSAPSDAINACGVTTAGSETFPDLYMQNCRVVNVHGQNATTHSDIYQPQGPIGRIFVDKFTGDTNYQGFFLSPEDNGIGGLYMSRVNLGYNAITPSDATTYLLWLMDDASGTPFPVALDRVYCNPRSGQNVQDDAVWPNSSVTGAAAYVNADGDVSWSANGMRVSGVVIPGAPPAGDFAPAGNTASGSTSALPGLNYVSPGYQHQPEPAAASTTPPQTKNIIVPGAIAVPSGATNYIPPVFVTVPAGESLSLSQIRSVVRAGTSVTFQVLHNGAAPTGWTGLSATPTAASSSPAAVALADGDTLQVVVTAVSGTPDGLTVELVMS